MLTAPAQCPDNIGYQVFISHASTDFKVAKSIYSALQAKDIQVWFAPKDIQPGEEWSQKISDAIIESDLMVLVYSANADRSKWVKSEVQH